MPVSLKNTSGEVLYLGREGRRVDVGADEPIDGELAKVQPDDAYVIGEGADARAYPKSLWTLGGKSRKDADTAAPSEESA